MPADHSYLIDQLEKRLDGVKMGRPQKKVFDVWGIPGLEITRWKYNEYDYYSPEKAQMAIPARGLFTVAPDRLLVRGYDKFFNVGEVKTTKLPYLQEALEGPFYATVKENGYLVLIAGYNGKLVVTSKNSSGPSSAFEDGKSHSEAARNWVLRHLASVGKTEKDFADLLEANDWTAVGEACDSEFEEHVLSYDESIAGIYLNGLNHNTVTFTTEPPTKVQEISNEFGFRRTDFVEFEDFASVMEFLETGQKSGKYGDRDVEGFVVRARTKSEKNDFFFKFKFDEPYLMFREWREVLMILVNSGEAQARRRAGRSKHRTSTLKFLMFARDYLKKRPDLVEKLQGQGQGHIELRDRFVATCKNSSDATPASAGILDPEAATTQALLSLDISIKKYLLVTVATLGCGKSTVAEVLTHLMPSTWGHRQNDAMKATKHSSKFVRLQEAVFDDFLDGKDVVILDRNNSSRQERQQIFDEFTKIGDEVGIDVQFVCLNFLPTGVSDTTKQLTRQRVYARGDNHSTVKLSALNEKGVSGIMSQFESRFQPVNINLKPDNQFDTVIELAPGESVDNVRSILNNVRKTYPKLEIPEFSEEEIRAVFEHIRTQQTTQSIDLPVKTAKKSKDKRSQEKQQKKEKQQGKNSENGNEKDTAENKDARPQRKKVRANYFGVFLDGDAYSALMALAEKYVPEAVLREFTLQKQLHVTLNHKRSHEQHFSAMMSQYSPRCVASDNGKYVVENEYRDVKVCGVAWSPVAAAFFAEVQDCANVVAHLTIGTKEGTPAKDANKLFNGQFEKEGLAVERRNFEPVVFKNQKVVASL